MILTVTLNAAIDKRYVVENFQEGEVNRVLECEYVPGGKGLNVSKPLAIAGADVVATGFVGGHAGAYICDRLKDFKVKDGFYRVAAESRSCINIWDTAKKKQTEFLEPGFVIDEKDWKGFEEKFKELAKDAEVVTISGSVPKGLDSSAYKKLISIVKDLGKKVILDTSGKLLTEAVEEIPYMIKPNIDEIAMLTGEKINVDAPNFFEDVIAAAKRVHNMGVKLVVVSLGADGSLMVCDDGVFRAIVPRVDAVNTVGCGDSMIAGFALGISEGLSPVETMRKASAISAASAMTEETGRFNISDMKNILHQIDIKQIDR
ncbi:1-phosphofructokinase [Pseudobutyrivibrio sp.]|uniref:1-phosphofructokinase n=1 Tax=Pseudobutyrivibrio sp. TaxID=2014367 RepID=UPI001D7CA1D7|nr:1-phosphofructokinase [Pseudobutyrivibrio sp.]MBE5910071.1 1-phosphofructokinase [Pseudobutyrivibrio sp.]